MEKTSAGGHGEVQTHVNMEPLSDNNAMQQSRLYNRPN